MSRIVTITIVAEVPEWVDPDDPTIECGQIEMQIMAEFGAMALRRRDMLHFSIEPGFSSAATTLPFSEEIEHLMEEN